jgi:hypothetical protein
MILDLAWSNRFPTKLYVVFTLFCCLQPLFAGGEADPILARSDELIKEKKFHEAIKLLSDFIQKDDKRFDDAQKRIRKLLKMFDDYNKVLKQLLDILEKDPDNFTTVIALTNELKKIDAPLDDETRFFVDKMHEMARFTAQRNSIERILREGRALIDAEDYVAALKKYQSGFDIYKEDMLSANFGKNVEQNTNGALNSVSEAISIIAQTIQSINNVRDSVLSMSNYANTPQNKRILNNAVQSLLPQLDTLIKAKTELGQAETFFSKTASIPEIDQSGKEGSNFFPAAALFMRGRSNMPIREGMLGAVDAVWKRAILPLTDAFGTMAEESYHNAMTNTENENYQTAKTNIAQTRDIILPINELSQRSQSFTDLDTSLQTRGYNSKIFSSINESVVRFKSMDNSLSYFTSAGVIGVQFSSIKERSKNSNFWNELQAGRISPERAFSNMENIQKEYSILNKKVEDELTAITQDINRLDNQIAGRQFKSSDDEEKALFNAGLRYYDDSHRIMEKLGQGISDDEVASIKKLYTIANANVKKQLDQLEKNYAESRRLMDGVEIKTTQGQTVKAKYSREAANILSGMKNDLTSGIKTADVILAKYKNDTENEKLAENLKNEAGDISHYSQRLRELNTNSARELAVATDRAGRAESFRVDGERFLKETKQALGANNFDLAREKLERTVMRFAESLDLQENSELRREWELNIAPLSKEIARLEYDYIIREVRDLIDSSRNKYFAGDFNRAEESLIRAETRWARINPEPNNEIFYWLNLVKNALAMRSGSQVPLTAPLYPEISQLLSDAKRNYNAGLSFFKESKREEGIIEFDMAKEKTQKVRFMFPVNQEAGLIDLRIDKIIDPEAFELTFQQRFVTAVAGTKLGSKEAYLELENLSHINPGYNGMQAALTEAKYILGILPRPVDNKTETESTALLAQAQRMFSRNNAAQYNEVLRLTARAISLNPNNTPAMQFADRVRLAMGSRNAIVSDQGAEQLYVEAVREFQRGNNIMAMTIVDRILQNPANKNNLRFNELQRRINSTL